VPGVITRQPVPRGLELGYAEIAQSFASTVSGATDVPGLSIVVREPPQPYALEAWTYGLAGSVLNAYAFMQIVEGANVLVLAENYVTGIAATGRQTTAKCRMPAPAVPGTQRTFKVQILGGGGSIPTLTAAATGKAYLQALAC
jgi:hypothetical protein